MKKPVFRFFAPTCLAAACCLLITSARAEVKTFVVDPALSSLTLSGSALSITVQQQGDGSRTAFYSGSILADVTETLVTFQDGSEVVANNSGSWQPAVGGVAGNAPANYGAYANGGIFGSGYAALRNFKFGITSGSISMLSGTFAANGLTFHIPDGTATADYTYSSSVFGSDSGTEILAGQTVNGVVEVGNISVVGDELVLTIPVNYTLVVSDISGQFNLSGTLVARAPNVVPLTIPSPVITPGHIGFTIPTTPGKTYTILGSDDLTTPLAEWAVIDQFVATSSSEARDIAIAIAGQQFFILRED